MYGRRTTYDRWSAGVVVVKETTVVFVIVCNQGVQQTSKVYYIIIIIMNKLLRPIPLCNNCTIYIQHNILVFISKLVNITYVGYVSIHHRIVVLHRIKIPVVLRVIRQPTNLPTQVISILFVMSSVINRIITAELYYTK